MNKRTIEVGQPEQKQNSESTAQDISVCQPCAKPNVVGSREIKFRFWLGHIRKMTYEHSLSEIGKIIPDFTEDIIPLQFTGLKDKNGKEIYEGDIVKTSLSFSSYEFMPPYHPTGHDGYGEIDCTGTIQFKDSCFVFYCMKVLKETNVWHDEYNLTKHFINKYHPLRNVREVLGNVFENPELLHSVV